jgi:hypothetical protein
MTRERNRDRDRTKTREEWERENEARVARGEKPIPESEMTRELDERNQADEPTQERAAARPAPQHGQEIEEFTPEVPTLRPDYTYGEGRWNNPENVKDAIHYFEHERPREREQQQEHSAALEKEREEAAMRDGAENLEQKKPHRYDAGAALEKIESEQQEHTAEHQTQADNQQETTDNRTDSQEDSRQKEPHRYDAGAALERVEKEQAGRDKSEDRERDHDRDQWPER